MASTNQMLVISNNMNNEIGYLFLILTALIIIYIIASVQFQKLRVEKLKRVKTLIEDGRRKKISETRTRH